MNTKEIERIIKPSNIHWVGNGFRVHNLIPGSEGLSMERMNPFILLDYNAKHYFPPSEEARGVGVHPHRGFETVTIAYKGKVAHHDSAGNSGVIEEGEVQWMTAGAGILHKEYHEENFNRQGGDFHMVQLWVNLPTEYKMTAPTYQSITRESIQRYYPDENRGIIEVIAGNHKGVQGTASTFSDINLFNAKLSKGTKENFSFPAHFNTALLVIEGSVKINKSTLVPGDRLVLFKNSEGTDFELEAFENTIVLILSGEPINEPIAAKGPFVMNTREELAQAYLDFNSGKFGYLED